MHARKIAKLKIAKCTEQQQGIFRRMYAPDIDCTIEEVIDRIPEGRLNKAMQQIERTLDATV